MVAIKHLSVLGFALGIAAQAAFGAPENSAQILSLLEDADDATIKSGIGAAAYVPNNDQATETLTDENARLLTDWQTIISAATDSPGFYSAEGAQNIINFINLKLSPDTTAADLVYTTKRDVFVAGGFIDYINPGLIKLRTAVDAAGAAVQAKTPAKYLTPMALAFLSISQNYANTQEIQMFGPGAAVYNGACGCVGIALPGWKALRA